MAYRMRLTLKLFYFGDSFRGSAAMNLQSCNEHTVDFLKKQIEKTVKFINEYRWIIDAYVSDFFTDGHWEKLPEGWTAVLSKLEPPDLAFLLDSTLPIPNRKDLPLSLLAFRESTHTLSVDRQKVDLEASQVVDRLFTADSDRELKIIVSPDSGIKVQTQAKADIKYGQYLPLNSCFRANVKPKKQHEILQLGKAIKLLGSHCDCDHVVDVGAGKGHLSRLLAFGYGYKVTTVEAAGCHAPKAQKIDRNIQKKIHRKLKRKHEAEKRLEPDSVMAVNKEPSICRTSLPDHVTCLIQPGTSAGKFLEIVKDSYKKQTECADLEDKGIMSTTEESSQVVIGSKPKLSDLEKKLSLQSGISERGSMTSPNILSDNVDTIVIKSKTSETLADEKSNSTPGLTTCNKSKHFPDDISRSTVSNNNNNQPSCPVDLSRFVLAGLHACGDLTPTMLRIFTECSHIVGLASVACCYMKLSCDEQGQGKTEDFEVGYPMSCFTKNIADSHLSFEAREMACHFADSYQERLIANSPNLKLHCYRAALQYIIKQTHPEFNHGSIRLTLKRAEELPFESYVQHSLEKIGSGSDVQALVMQQAHSYLPYWQNVVAFYTLRLSLAPVVESLILLDRMMYLYEHGIPSALLPIFDPALSPRNFVLLASKNKTANF